MKKLSTVRKRDYFRLKFREIYHLDRSKQSDKKQNIDESFNT